MSAADSAVSLEEVTKSFNRFTAVDSVSLEIKKNEVFGLLGPSGCGKTTILRLIAGLETPDSGNILLDGRTVVSMSSGQFVPPHKRNLGMVFQSYAIWPHMSVFDNVAYPLKVRDVKSKEVRERVGRILELVNLVGLEDRQGPQLSGGQQQRVALARALVYEPSVLLLDEPFSNLDAKLREQMRLQVKLLLDNLAITVVLVTHDQIEGLSLSNRIAILNDGKVEQIGVPRQLYQNPETPFVRDFLGNTLLLRGKVRQVTAHDCVAVDLGGSRQIMLRVTRLNGLILHAGDEAIIAIRPEEVEIVPHDSDPGGRLCLPGRVETLLFVGDHYECCVRLDNNHLATLRTRVSADLCKGTPVGLSIPETAIRLWPV